MATTSRCNQMMQEMIRIMAIFFRIKKTGLIQVPSDQLLHLWGKESPKARS